jgi:alpha-galactosidase
LVYPNIAMGCHVSAVPNHQVHRVTPFATRGISAMGGNYGYELDLTKLSDEEKSQVKAQVAFYKEIRKIIQFGDFYRLKSPFEGNEIAWTFVAKDKSEAVVSFFRQCAEPNPNLTSLRTIGLDPKGQYQDRMTGIIYGGDELMYVGLNVPDTVSANLNIDGSDGSKELFAGMVSPIIKGDYAAFIWHLKKIK